MSKNTLREGLEIAGKTLSVLTQVAFIVLVVLMIAQFA